MFNSTILSMLNPLNKIFCKIKEHLEKCEKMGQFLLTIL